MKKLNIILLNIIMIFIFLGCSTNTTRYKNLDTCQTELIVNKSSGMLNHQIYKIDIPAKTSIRIRDALINTTGENDSGIYKLFNEKEVGLLGDYLTSQVISITGNDNIQKKVIKLDGDESYNITENGNLDLENLISQYNEKDIEILRTGNINNEDLYKETYDDVKIINYPYLNSSSVLSFWLTNNTETTQTIYYNIFIKDTEADIWKGSLSYVFEFATELWVGDDTNSNEKEKKKIDYFELSKIVSTTLKNDNIEKKIKTMEEYYVRKYIKTKVKEVIENNFGELSNGQDKILKYFITVYTDIYIYSNPYFFVS